MLCDDCKQQPAAVHLTQIINGQKTELHLCLACANRRNVQIWPVLAFPTPGFKPPDQPARASGFEDRACPHCRYTWREFVSTGFLGCTKCYSSFAELLTPIIAKNYGPIRHQGKFPQTGSGSLRIRREIAALRKELEKSVAAEDFEKAAKIRDQIHDLEQKV